MPGIDSKKLPGWRALPGDLLYLERGDHEEADRIAPGYYVLAGQCAPEEVLLRRADEGDGGALLSVSVRTLARMVVVTGRATDGSGMGAGVEDGAAVD